MIETVKERKIEINPDASIKIEKSVNEHQDEKKKKSLIERLGEFFRYYPSYYGFPTW